MGCAVNASSTRLLIFGDSCSGVPDHPHERTLATLVGAILARPRDVDVLCYLGDHVAGYTASDAELAAQWSYFLEHEFEALSETFATIHHIPSNHTAYDRMSSSVYARVLPVHNERGLVACRGLNYAVRDRQAVLVFLNTADPDNNGQATIDLAWLREVLAQQASAPLKLIFGHHPIHPVNGYTRHPMWCLPPTARAEAWALFREYRVRAYICSHILAFDFQVHDDIIKLCSGGGGTSYGPGGLMPGTTEYHHFIECAISNDTFSCSVFDVDNQLRERVTWPLCFGPATEWRALGPTEIPIDLPPPTGWRDPAAARAGFAFLIAATTPRRGRSTPIVSGWNEEEGPPILSIGFEGEPQRIIVKAVSFPGEGPQVWTGPQFEPGAAFSTMLAFDPCAGPGGVLIRSDHGTWSSLSSASARGLSRMAWPQHWLVGRDSIDSDGVYEGSDLRVAFATLPLRM
jgi:hypothetical protein